MDVTTTDEALVHNLYNEYKNRRENIRYDHYQSIFRAAESLSNQSHSSVEDRKTGEQEAFETGLGAVLKEIEIMEKSNEHGLSVDDTLGSTEHSPRVERKTGFFSEITARLVSSLQFLFKGPVLAGAVMTGFLMLGLITLVPNSDNTGADLAGAISKSATSLAPHGDFVMDELFRISTQQYGFAAGQSSFSKSFSAGVYLVDLISLQTLPLTQEKIHISEQLISKVSFLENVEPQVLANYSHNELLQLRDNLFESYKEKNMLSAFLFGQWVEMAYLLTRLDNSVGNNHPSHGLFETVDLMESKLKSEAFLTDDIAKELDAIRTASMAPNSLVSHLLKMRIMFMMR